MSKIIGNTVGTTMNPKKIASDFGLLSIQETEEGVLLTTKDNKPLILSPYELQFTPTIFGCNIINPVSGFKVATPKEDFGAVNKGYVDNLVGDIDAALEAILAIQNGYLNEATSLENGGDE